MSDIVVIGGCGHVGLPLGLAFARVGKKVVAFDIDEPKVAQVNQGKMPFYDRGADELLHRLLAQGSFRASHDPKVIQEAKILISVIGTPVDEHLNPRYDVMRRLVLADRSHFRSGQLFVMRSTLYPGTTQRIYELLQSEGLDLDVAFCPERVAQGQALEEISTLPQIVAGCTDRAQQRAADLFRTLDVEIVPLSPTAAELTKLFTNSWRYIQFAVANQFYMIANEHGIDFYEIHKAMTQNYPRAQGFPKAGFAAGPCLFKDTMQLSAFHNNAFFLGHTAMLVNEGLPNYVVQGALRRYELKKMKAGILGMTFKADCDDPRDSLAFKLRKILQLECREVLCSDPYLKGEEWRSLEEVMSQADILFVGVPHKEYRSLNFGTKPVIDIWNAVCGGTSK